jgi:hypothetical protein
MEIRAISASQLADAHATNVLVVFMTITPLDKQPQPPRASVLQHNSVNRCFLDNQWFGPQKRRRELRINEYTT